jgi:hypothetical protein
MKLRIANRIDHLGRRFLVEKQVGWGPFKSWTNVGDVLGYKSEAEAKEFAEDYARGDWISDQATFRNNKK